MSIRKLQTERVLEDVARALYATGVVPTLNEVFAEVGDYFAEFPVGLPLPIPLDYITSKEVSNVEKFNLILAHLSMNLDVLYEVCLGQVDEVMLLTTSLQSYIERLRARRRRLETTIDNYLLSLYNTDGYYYSAADTFSDANLTDFAYTSAYIDTQLGAVTLPTISSLSTRLDPSLIGEPLVSVSVTTNNLTRSSTYQTIAPWSGAVDGLSNTVWEIQVETDRPSEVVVTLTMPIGNQDNTVQLSRVDLDPYGISEVQAFMEMGTEGSMGGLIYSGFGGKVETNQNRMSFIDVLQEVQSFRLTLRKTVFDYNQTGSGTAKYRYVIGLKDLSFVSQVYDNQATFISSPLAIPTDLENDMVIDAVSLAVEEEVQIDTSLVYYIAGDLATASYVGDFNWQRITPVGGNDLDATTVVHFGGANSLQRYIRSSPTGSDLQLIALNNTNPDLRKRNPSPVIIPGVDLYRLATFEDEPITNTMVLEEGVNATRIYYTDVSGDATSGLDWWAPKIKAGTLPVVYGRIDIGNEFFYGGDIGESGKSVYVETYIEVDSEREALLAELRKTDANSQSWSIRVFLNGREVGWLPGDNLYTSGASVDKLLIPWTLQEGLNHIALIINIPPGTTNVPNPYIGTISLLGGNHLFDFGVVKLGTWSYVDFFDLQYNQVYEPMTFSIFDKEIVTRRKPTTNYRLRYSKSTAKGPSAVRLRADLARDDNNMHVTPKLNGYRVRFSYGN